MAIPFIIAGIIAAGVIAAVVVTMDKVTDWIKENKRKKINKQYASLIRDRIDNSKHTVLTIGLTDDDGYVTKEVDFTGELDSDLVDLFAGRKKVEIEI